jgi:hypothetical protein
LGVSVLSVAGKKRGFCPRAGVEGRFQRSWGRRIFWRRAKSVVFARVPGLRGAFSGVGGAVLFWRYWAKH